MDVCKCIVPLRHGCTLNNRRAASPLAWLVEKVERWEAPDHPQVSSLKIGAETTQIVLSSVWCSKATAYDRRHLALCHDEFREPRFEFCRSAGINNNYNNGRYALESNNVKRGTM
ncbi:uncharacterized protein TNCV_2085371 [Trichonephila clavipes]|uniref:Uncharacterized protein n=1 Tax=Trichonephila clavipes TaxID=2585209 RepID=A0A8X6V5Q7_TRICX|nr:uncharacterized protein TNCV_2085371 [Trichonephila clavipes]